MAEYRVWMLEQFENEILIEDHGADPVVTVGSVLDGAAESLTEVDAALL